MQMGKQEQLMARPQQGTTRASGKSKGPTAIVNGGGMGEEGRDSLTVPSGQGLKGLRDMGSLCSLLVERNDRRSQDFEAEGRREVPPL